MDETANRSTVARGLDKDVVPGFSMERQIVLIKRAIQEMELDLTSFNILTEAATGAYGVTPIIAALANAKRVYAFTRSSPYGSVDDVTQWTMQLARAADVAGQIDIIQEVPSAVLGDIDIVTNSGHLRPIRANLINQLPSSAVIALMFEAWELRPQDIDLPACAARNIPIVGVNERHPAVDVFSYLGPLSVKQLHECGIAVYNSKIALLCDNSFDEPIMRGLKGLGADVELFSDISRINADGWDAVVIALKPAVAPRIGRVEAQALKAATKPWTVVVQFWGDIDCDAARDSGLRLWPAQSPKNGHMAVLLSAIGPESIVRLQTGGLRAAEFVRRGGIPSPEGYAQLVSFS